MGMAGRHRFENRSIRERVAAELHRGIYWGTRTTQAMMAATVALVAVILMAVLPALAAPAVLPQQTAAQQTLSSSVVAWQARLAAATRTTAQAVAEADSGPKAEAKTKTKTKTIGLCNEG